MPLRYYAEAENYPERMVLCGFGTGRFGVYWAFQDPYSFFHRFTECDFESSFLFLLQGNFVGDCVRTAVFEFVGFVSVF